MVGSLALLAIGLTSSFWIAIGLLVLWSLAFSVSMPMRQAYVNGLIDSDQRATVLSFDALMASSGGVAAQPALGRVADVWSYAASYRGQLGDLSGGGAILRASPGERHHQIPSNESTRRSQAG